MASRGRPSLSHFPLSSSSLHVSQARINAPPSSPSRRQRRYHGPAPRPSPSAVHPVLCTEFQGPERVQRKILQAQKKVLGTRRGQVFPNTARPFPLLSHRTPYHQ